jgi:hypothetical protein
MKTPTEYLRKIGRRGGKARAKVLTAQEKRAIGRKGAAARWGAKRKRRGKKVLDRQAPRADTSGVASNAAT